MTRISSIEQFQQGIDNILRQQARLNQTQLELSTGKKVNKPSDDPSAATQLLKLSTLKSNTNQYDRNIDAARNQLELQESVLANVGNVLQRVRELVIQANNATQSNQSRAAIADELYNRIDELLQYANTKDPDGEYIFSGFNARTPAYVKSGAGYTYQGDQGQRFLQISEDTQIAVRNNGEEIFSGALNGDGRFILETPAANQGNALVKMSSTSSAVSDDYSIRFADPRASVTVPSGERGATSRAAVGATDLTIQIGQGAAIPIGANDGSSKALAVAITDAIPEVTAIVGVTKAGPVQAVAAALPSVGKNITINGVPTANFDISADASADRAAAIAAINNITALTGVVATETETGAGSGIELSAEDGRSIQLSSTLDANSDVGLSASGTYDAELKISAKEEITIGEGVGGTLANTGLSAGTAPVVGDKLKFEVLDSAGLVLVAGDYQTGASINFKGIALEISGTPIDGDSFSINKSQKQDLFEVVRQIADSLSRDLASGSEYAKEANDLGQALLTLDQISTGLQSERTTVGNRLQSLERRLEENAAVQLRLEKQISELQDLDFAQAVSQLNIQSTALQAAQQSYIRIQGLSLFNFLR